MARIEVPLYSYCNVIIDEHYHLFCLQICDEVGAYLMADMAHISGLVATGVSVCVCVCVCVRAHVCGVNKLEREREER